MAKVGVISDGEEIDIKPAERERGPIERKKKIAAERMRRLEEEEWGRSP